MTIWSLFKNGLGVRTLKTKSSPNTSPTLPTPWNPPSWFCLECSKPSLKVVKPPCVQYHMVSSSYEPLDKDRFKKKSPDWTSRTTTRTAPCWRSFRRRSMSRGGWSWMGRSTWRWVSCPGARSASSRCRRCRWQCQTEMLIENIFAKMHDINSTKGVLKKRESFVSFWNSFPPPSSSVYVFKSSREKEKSLPDSNWSFYCILCPYSSSSSTVAKRTEGSFSWLLRVPFSLSKKALFLLYYRTLLLPTLTARWPLPNTKVFKGEIFNPSSFPPSLPLFTSEPSSPFHC